MYLMGPSGAYAPDPAADWHLLVGDETALPFLEKAARDSDGLIAEHAGWARFADCRRPGPPFC